MKIVLSKEFHLRILAGYCDFRMASHRSQPAKRLQYAMPVMSRFAMHGASLRNPAQIFDRCCRPRVPTVVQDLLFAFDGLDGQYVRARRVAVEGQPHVAFALEASDRLDATLAEHVRVLLPVWWVISNMLMKREVLVQYRVVLSAATRG